VVGIDGMGSTTRRVWRLAFYLCWTVLLIPVQIVGLILRRSWTATFPCFYHRWCCRILGLKIRRIGQPAATRPILFAANHVSYIDITVLGALIPGSFVAKTEVARWPLFGQLAKLQRSVFVDRKVHSTARQRDAISERLARRDALILFPEGTSGDGNRVLPFKSALFGAATHPAEGTADAIVVQPVSIAYTRIDGMPLGRRYRPLLAWYGGMAMAPHLWRVLGLGTVEVVVEFHPVTTYVECGSRKALAQLCYERVAAGVAAALAGRSPHMSGSGVAGRRGPKPGHSDVAAHAVG